VAAAAGEGLGCGKGRRGRAGAPQGEVVGARLGPPGVRVGDQIPPRPAADRAPPELRPLAMSDLEEGALTVVLVVLDGHAAQLRRPHPCSEQDLDLYRWPTRRSRGEDLLRSSLE